MKLCLEQMYCHGVSHLECLFVSDVYVCLFYLNKVCNKEDKSCSVCKAIQKEASPQQVSGGCSLHVFFSDISHHMAYMYMETHILSDCTHDLCLVALFMSFSLTYHIGHIWRHLC